MKQNHHNYLPDQYKSTEELKINHNYLGEQFSDSEEILNDIKNLVRMGDFTLGHAVDELENEFKTISDTNYAIGVGSGTDAIFLSLICFQQKPAVLIKINPKPFICKFLR